MSASRDLRSNVAVALDLIAQAADAGAQYIQTPEVTTLMELDRTALFRAIEPEDSSAALAAFRMAARDHSVWLHIGSMAVRVSADRLANRSYLISPEGEIAARYDKIHMFDVELPNGESYRESLNYVPGTAAVVADLPWTRLGLTICYDLRFPYLHRALAKAGAAIIAGPAAFTRTTGEAHWHALLRARAIETQCFVLAAAQTGLHEMGRETYGHSLAVSPWGEILADGGTAVGVTMVEIDPAQAYEVRQ
ncbi:MAG: carbon-nitrogen hydrolase family protein, partial [Hyphomicrobiaceae bacterium]